MNAIISAVLGLIGIVGVLVSFVGIKVPFAEGLAKDNWRHGLGALLLFIMTIPVTIGLFMYAFDANQFKEEIVHFVRVQTQRDLVLQGDIHVKFFPKLGLETGNISLSQRNSAKEFASVNNARMYVAWWPLLKKQLVFDRVEIDGLSANLIRHADGSTNYDDLLIRDENIAPVTFDIDGVRIRHSTINWQDEMKWQRVSLQDLQLETGRIADEVPSHLSASFHFDAEKLRSNGNVELKSSLFYERKTGRYEFADIEGKLEGDSAWINNVTLNFKGGVESYPDASTLSAVNVSMTAVGKVGQRNIEARLDTPKLQYQQHKLSGAALNVEASTTLSGETVKASIQLPEFSELDRLFSSQNATATFDLNGEGHTLHGKLTSAVTLNLQDAARLQFDHIALGLAATHPALAGELAANVTGSAQLDVAAQMLKLDFKARYDDSEIGGTAAVKDFGRPAYTFDINANRLDLDRYLSKDWLRRWRDDAAAFDVSALKNLNLNGSLRAAEIRLAHRRLGKFSTGIKVDQATLTIAPLAANAYGGSLSGSISIAAQGVPAIAITQHLRAFKADGLFADATDIPRLTGNGDLALDLSAEGGSVGALRRSLNGTASLTLARGALYGFDLRAALLAGKSDLGAKNSARVSAAMFADKTEFSALKASLNINDGSSTGNSFEMKSPLFTTVGEGEFATDSGKFDYRLNATLAARLNRSTAGELAELKGVTVPLRVSGHYAAPSFALDFAAASGGKVAHAAVPVSQPSMPVAKRQGKKTQ